MKTLSIIIPVYNEVKSVEKVIDTVSKVNVPVAKQIIVVEDGSSDGTRELLQKLEKEKYTQKKGTQNKQTHLFLYHPYNQGKGHALRTGIKHVTGDFVLVQDADLEYNPEEYPQLLEPLLKNTADVVFGNRFHEGHQARYTMYYWGNIILSWCTRILYNRKIQDMETGYKVFRREVLQKIQFNAHGFDFEPEITAKVLRSTYRLVEVPITYHSRSFEEGKKITWRDGVKALWCLVKYRFS